MNTAKTLSDEIFDLATAAIKPLPSSTRYGAMRVLSNIKQADQSYSISSLPAKIYQSFMQTKSVPVEIKYLALGSVLGWLERTLLDDIIDGDKDVDWVPSVNFIAGLARKEFNQLNNTEFISLVDELYSKMDYSNLWEMSKCRWVVATTGVITGHIPTYVWPETLVNKSIGHKLGAMGAMSVVGFKFQSRESVALGRSLEYMLAARQLSDDLVDWMDDLQAGIINSVASRVLKLTQFKRGDQLSDELLKLAAMSFPEIAIETCTTIIEYCDRSLSEIDKYTELKNIQEITKPVTKIRYSAESLLIR